MEESEDLIIIPDPVGDRYGTFGFISWWDQKRLKDATVMVVGAGALGNEVLKDLALMGIGRLFIVDFDTIEPGNLSRCVLFRASDSGQRKAEVAARSIQGLNPDVKIQTFHGDINHELGLGVFRRMDVVVGCLDNREARLSINRFCYALNKPWVDGGIESLLGYARVFWPGRGACYECTLTDADYRNIRMRRSCSLLARENLVQGKVPTTPTAASIIGGVQAQETLKLIQGLEVQPGTSFVFNGLTNDSYTTRLPVKKDCESHDTLDEIIEIPGARTDSTTAAGLMEVARRHLGPGARLMLGYDLLTGWRCRNCGQNEAALGPFYNVPERAGICPSCGKDRIPDTVSELTGAEPFAGLPLQELGLPPLSILTAYNGEQVIGLELTGDAEAFLSFQ